MAKAGEDAYRIALFNKFCDSTSFVEILRLFEELCGVCSVDHHQYHGLVQDLKQKLSSWKCLDIFKIFETKANHPVYKKQKCCEGMRCLVIGAGPVGLRSAIEAALLGAKVDVVEKRDDFSRNNVLHLWPFLLTDLRNLGAKKFYGKFCSGDLDHISIRMLQAVLLKAALLLGVKVHPSVEFKSVIEPAKGVGWKVGVSPSSCPVSNYEFDIMLGADGKKYVLPGFRTKEFRPKLAIAITANYVNHGTQEEAKVQEISGISYVYHQDFFNRLSEEHGIELENVVYYRDETHYFVMTPKKQSLLQRGVLKQDNTDVKQLLSPSNISPQALKQYAKEVAVYSTKGGFRMESLEFKKNHRGEDDVALFDFTSLFAAENAARIIERQSKKLLMCLAGDSLIEPFWPTGSGCARGFLGALDAAWMMRGFGEGRDPLELIEERESTLQLLSQTKPERLQKNYQTYSIDPSTRYLDIAEMVAPGDISHLYDRGQGSLEPTVIIKSGLASSSTRKRGIARDKRPKTIAGINPSREYGVENKVDLELLKTWGKVRGSKFSSSTRKEPLIPVRENTETLHNSVQETIVKETSEKKSLLQRLPSLLCPFSTDKKSTTLKKTDKQQNPEESRPKQRTSTSNIVMMLLRFLVLLLVVVAKTVITLLVMALKLLVSLNMIVLKLLMRAPHYGVQSTWLEIYPTTN